MFFKIERNFSRSSKRIRKYLMRRSSCSLSGISNGVKSSASIIALVADSIPIAAIATVRKGKLPMRRGGEVGVFKYPGFPSRAENCNTVVGMWVRAQTHLA